MLSNVLLVVSMILLGIVLVVGVRAVLEQGLAGLGKMGAWTYAVFGAYVLAFAGFLLTQGA